MESEEHERKKDKEKNKRYDSAWGIHSTAQIFKKTSYWLWRKKHYLIYDEHYTIRKITEDLAKLPNTWEHATSVVTRVVRASFL